MTSPRTSLFPEFRAARAVFRNKRYLGAYPLLVLLTGLAYAFLLSWLSVGTVALWGLRFLTPLQVTLTLGFAFLFPWLVLVDVYLWRHPTCIFPGRIRGGEGTPVVGVLLGILPNALCCTPIIPTLLALFVSGSTLLSVSVPVQYAIASYEPEFYAASLILLWIAIRLASRRLVLGQGETAEAASGSVAPSLPG